MAAKRKPAVKPTKKPAAATKKPAAALAKVEAALRAFALSLPGTVEEFPWGHVAVKVNKKAFVFMGQGDDGGGFSMSAKLPQSAEMALTFPFASPTGYGLGKSGWVSAQFGAKEKPPVGMLKDWIEESYRAIAPKKLAATLD